MVGVAGSIVASAVDYSYLAGAFAGQSSILLIWALWVWAPPGDRS